MYHTFLHHSQTNLIKILNSGLLVYHTFLHHSQTDPTGKMLLAELVYHTFLHHSQTVSPGFESFTGLCTIHFYIILKRFQKVHCRCHGLCTIHFYIILKPVKTTKEMLYSLCTIHFYIILKHNRMIGTLFIACVPYIFTSFSNLSRIMIHV